MKKLGTLVFLLLIGLTVLRAQPTDYQSLKAQAEKYYAEGSYALAHDLYGKAASTKLPQGETRWVSFRIADTLWRSQAATQTADTTKYEQAQKQLEELIREVEREEDRDRVWAETQESLGDFFWIRRDSKNWTAGWQYYQQALDWWAGSDQIDFARQRYLNIVWKIAKPEWVEPYYYYGYYGNFVPLETLENVLKIAKTENDKAHAHFLIAMTIRQQGGDDAQRQRAAEEFEAALKAGRTTDWYDDALFYYAEWLNNYGHMVRLENGQWRQEPDYVKALELYRRFLAEHIKGESRYYDQAKQQIENITKQVVSVSVSNIFLPDSEIQFYLNWRNIKRINLSIYRVTLTEDVRFNTTGSDWMQQMDLSGRKPVKSWVKETEDKGDYKPGQENIHLDTKLPVGAYIVQAGMQNPVRDLLLVTDVTLVSKTSSNQALFYLCDVTTGAPVENGFVKMWEYIPAAQGYWKQSSKQTDKQGIAVFDLEKEHNNSQIFAVAASEGRQAFSSGYSYWYNAQILPWRIYAYTDRPAYRPGETVHWKFVARQYDGSVYTTPSNRVVEYEIYDPRGAKIKENKVTLNAFGTAWDNVDVTDAMPLGEYRLNFWDEGRRQNIGGASLFRLEEYKLPEFKVSIQIPEENGKKKAFQLGEQVEATIQADYYFGGPVSNASVEVLVYQNPFYHWWYPPVDYPWYYTDIYPERNPYYGGGQIIKRDTIKTDATGKAIIRFNTPRNTGQDYEYRIEARVTDASRREIVSSDSVRVTRQRYYVYANPQHCLYRPQDRVGIDIKALDANNNPVQAEGTIKVTRDYWYEIWIDPDGKEIKGKELEAFKEKIGLFPPAPSSPDKPWRLKFRGYEHDDVLTRPVKTDAKGEAEFTFTPEREGYYRLAWSSGDKTSPVTAETTVWVATNATSELGYRHGGLEIIVDKNTLHQGQKAPVLINVPTNDRYVLFSVEGENLYDYQLVHVTGTVKLIEVPIQEKHVPNIFLTGVMVTDRQLFIDTKQVIVPPEKHFLQVDVQSDREQYQPREDGTLKVTTRNMKGEPVSAELSLGLVDESVYYIQQDYAGDPRQFYFGSKRPQYVQTQSTFQQKSYAKLIVGAKDQLIDERQYEMSEGQSRFGRRAADSLSDAERDQLNALGYVGGEAGGIAAGAMGGVPAPAPQKSMMAKEEALTVTGEPALAPPAAPPAPAEPVQVRTDFRATVFWQPDVITDKSGQATIKVKYPDTLTSWKATARVVTQGSQFGIGSASTRTKKPLIVRLQAPRFFVVGDTVTISGVINNNTDQAMTVNSTLKMEGGITTEVVTTNTTNVAANGEARADWVVTVTHPGTAKLTITSQASNYSDAMEKTYTIYEHGIEKFVAKSGKIRTNDATILLNLPKERRATSMSIQVTPSMAVTMLDALPYLIDYPYGCTEQTMSRFLPSVITAKTLKDLGLNPSEIFHLGGIEEKSADKTHPHGRKNLGDLNAMVKAGLDRLYDFQHSDGGWGWWKDGESDHFMSAYVVWGMTLARDAGVDVREDSLSRGADFLRKELVEEEDSYDMQAWMLHAVASHDRRPDNFETKALQNLWNHRDRLNAYTRALLALSAHYFGDHEKAMTLVRNLENGVKRDNAPDTSILLGGNQPSSQEVMGTAHWGEDGIYWRWSDGGIEATSFALRALLAIDPQNKLIEPVTNWLIKNRRGAQWNSTRDTAITVLTLNDYLRKSGELAADSQFEVLVNGNSIAKRKITAADVLRAPSKFEIEHKFIRDGENEIRIRRTSGTSPIYFAAEAKFFSLEEPVMAAGNEIFVRREYFKLVGKPTLLKGYVYDKQPLHDSGSVRSGDRVETIITIEAKNNYEYLVFEDLKPAGLEAVQIRSGESLYAQELKANGQDVTGRTQWVYQELRDRKVALFVDHLPEGTWQIRYDMRAEVPGAFHALPVVGYAMYVPEIRANGAEIRFKVQEE